MLMTRKLITAKRFLFCAVILSLAMAYSGLTAKAESSSSSDRDSNKASATSRSVSTSRNGKTVSISGNDRSGITVTVTETVDGQPRQTVTQATNAADLARKNAAAYDLYQKHLKISPNLTTVPDSKTANAKAASNAVASDGGTAGKGTATVAPGADAREMLRRQLREMRAKNADNPAILKVIDDALRQVNELK